MSVRDVLRELSEISNLEVSQEDTIQLLRTMEADGILQFNERAQTVFVRTGGVLTN
jgi:DNA replication licensing factor MCM4